MTAGTKVRLRQIYRAVADASGRPGRRINSSRSMRRFGDAAGCWARSRCCRRSCALAQANLALPARGGGAEYRASQQQRREGDALTRYYVPEAAGSARFLPENRADFVFDGVGNRAR